MQRSVGLRLRGFRPEQSVHARHPGVQSEWHQDPWPAGQAVGLGWLPAGRPGGRHRVREWARGRPLVCDRLEPVSANVRQQQQLAHRHRRSDQRSRHAVHHRPSHRRSPVGTADIQGRLDLLVARFDDQQRRRRSRQWRWRQPAGDSVPGHRAEQQSLRLGWRCIDERLLAFQHATPRRDRAGVRKCVASRRLHRCHSGCAP